MVKHKLPGLLSDVPQHTKSDITVSTSFRKLVPTGEMERKCRGGRHVAINAHGDRLRESVKRHVPRYSRMESHYCPAKIRNQHSLKDLMVTPLHGMYNAETPDENASFLSSVIPCSGRKKN